MGITDRVRARWRHFMGTDFEVDEEALRAADLVDHEFQLALQDAQQRRAGFDTRPPPPAPSVPPLSLQELRDKVERADELVRKVLDDEVDD